MSRFLRLLAATLFVIAVGTGIGSASIMAYFQHTSAAATILSLGLISSVCMICGTWIAIVVYRQER